MDRELIKKEARQFIRDEEKQLTPFKKAIIALFPLTLVLIGLSRTFYYQEWFLSFQLIVFTLFVVFAFIGAYQEFGLSRTIFGTLILALSATLFALILIS